MWAMARPTVLTKVAPTSRTSGRKLDAENRRRSAMVAPVYQAGNDDRVERVPVEERHGRVQDVVGRERHAPADFARRPWVNRTAFGAPVDPEVKISKVQVVGVGSTGRWSAAGATSCAATRGRRRRGHALASGRPCRAIDPVQVIDCCR